MKKSHNLPQEVIDIFVQMLGAKDLREHYVKLRHGYKLAKRAATDYHKYRQLFWRKVMEIYPELEGKKLSLRIDDGSITVKDDEIL